MMVCPQSGEHLHFLLGKIGKFRDTGGCKKCKNARFYPIYRMGPYAIDCVEAYVADNVPRVVLTGLQSQARVSRVTPCQQVKILLGELRLGSADRRTCGSFGIARSTTAFLACLT
jgi:hypothetical protein